MRDAVLVDALLTKDESRALIGWVAAAGKKVTAIVVTHAHVLLEQLLHGCIRLRAAFG